MKNMWMKLCLLLLYSGEYITGIIAIKQLTSTSNRDTADIDPDRKNINPLQNNAETEQTKTQSDEVLTSYYYFEISDSTQTRKSKTVNDVKSRTNIQSGNTSQSVYTNKVETRPNINNGTNVRPGETSQSVYVKKIGTKPNRNNRGNVRPGNTSQSVYLKNVETKPNRNNGTNVRPGEKLHSVYIENVETKPNRNNGGNVRHGETPQSVIKNVQTKQNKNSPTRRRLSDVPKSAEIDTRNINGSFADNNEVKNERFKTMNGSKQNRRRNQASILKNCNHLSASSPTRIQKVSSSPARLMSKGIPAISVAIKPNKFTTSTSTIETTTAPVRRLQKIKALHGSETDSNNQRKKYKRTRNKIDHSIYYNTETGISLDDVYQINDAVISTTPKTQKAKGKDTKSGHRQHLIISEILKAGKNDTNYFTSSQSEIDYNGYYNTLTGISLDIVPPKRRPTFTLPSPDHSD